MRKIGILEIKGGLGNQLFILNFIQYLENNNFKVYSLTNFYTEQQANSLNTEQRHLYLDSNLMNLNIPKVKYSKFLSMIIQINSRKKSFLQKLIFRFLKLIICFADDNNLLEQIKGSKRIFFFDGYFQNYSLLQSADQLTKRLTVDPKFNLTNTNDMHDHLAVVHVRRKDYLKIGEELDLSYYENSLSFLKNSVQNLEFNVFTDDVEWCKKNSLFNEANFIKNASLEDTIKDFVEMSNYKYFVISNSTYSYMSAYLSRHNNKIVITPQPWFKKLDFTNYDLIINPNWVKIKNE